MLGYSQYNPRYYSGNRTRSSPSPSSSSSSSPIDQSKPRCDSAKYSLGHSQSSRLTSSITENDLLKYEDLNMDLKEINILFKDLKNNLKKINKKTKKNTQSNRNTKKKKITDEFEKTIKKILSEKLREKALQRLARLIKRPKEKRLNKVACAISALLEVLKSCNNSSYDYEYLMTKYKEKVYKDYKDGLNASIEFIKDILETKTTNLKDFISKQSIHNKKLGEILQTTIKDLPTCPA